ncbi:glycosyltransferase [bacterium]|nr:glycosyltransferase [bacterium]
MINGRTDFTSSTLAAIPFQLLPYAVYDNLALEQTLKWQSDFARDFGKFPTIAVLGLGRMAENFAVNLKTQSYQAVTELQCSGASDLAQTAELKSDYTVIVAENRWLHPQALFIFAKKISENPGKSWFANELIVEADLKQSKRYRARQYRRVSPQIDEVHFISTNVIGGALSLPTTLLKKILTHPSLKDLSPSALFEQLAFLALTAAPQTFKHIPLALTVCSGSAPELAASERVYLAQERLKLLGLKPTAVNYVQGAIDIKFSPQPASIQVVIPFKDQATLTIRCVQSLMRDQLFKDMRISLIDNNSQVEERKKISEAFKAVSQVEVISRPTYFNYAAVNNFGASLTKSDYILFMNNDVELRGESTVEKLLSWAEQPGVGLVGGLLYYPDGRIQSGGIRFASVRPANIAQANEAVRQIRKVNAVALAMALVKRSVFEAVGGLDEWNCPNGFGDALFGKKVWDSGKMVILNPFAEATHYESISRGRSVEELELSELMDQGVPIADLFHDRDAIYQPEIIDLDPLRSSKTLRKIVRSIKSGVAAVMRY